MHPGKNVKQKDHIRSTKAAKVDQNNQELEAAKQTFMSDVRQRAMWINLSRTLRKLEVCEVQSGKKGRA